MMHKIEKSCMHACLSAFRILYSEINFRRTLRLLVPEFLRVPEIRQVPDQFCSSDFMIFFRLAESSLSWTILVTSST